MARPPRALARRARRLLGYWRSERRTLRQGLVALALSTLAGFVAGLTIAHLTEPLSTYPGLLVLIPAAVGMKGTIFGAIGARLGHGERVGRPDAGPAPRWDPAAQRRRGDLHHVLLGPVARRADEARLRCVRTALDVARRPRRRLGVRRPAELGARPPHHRGPLRALLPAAVGPRRGVDADGHRARRHDHDPQPVPGDGAAGARRRPRGPWRSRRSGWRPWSACAASSPATAASGASSSRWPPRSPSRRCSTWPPAGCRRRACPSSPLVPVLLALIPPFVSQAGALGGIFSSRISSKLQVGVITARGRPGAARGRRRRDHGRPVDRRVPGDRRHRLDPGGGDGVAGDALRAGPRSGPPCWRVSP